jgi:hypothetical protein
VAPLRLVPGPFPFPLAGRIRLYGNGTAGVGGLEVFELDPHRLGQAGRIDEPVAAFYLEQNGCSVVVQLQDRRKALDRPALQASHHRISAHSDLVERRLDLVERQGAFIRQCQPRA